MYPFFVSLLLLFLLPLTSALPPHDSVRQRASVTTTTNTLQTANGTMTETCVLTSTPVGQQIQQIRNCTVTMGGSQATTLVAASSTATVAFVMPGTSIQVLPFGLGVYGGITAIAIVAVVFVTWERVQCRKGFRRQRMIENNAFGYYGGATKG